MTYLTKVINKPCCFLLLLNFTQYNKTSNQYEDTEYKSYRKMTNKDDQNEYESMTNVLYHLQLCLAKEFFNAVP